MTLEQFVSDYGYLAILLLTFLEGETVVIIAGIFASQAVLDINLVVLSALIGSFCGDQLWFYIGRHGGPRFLAKRKTWQVKADRVYQILHRHQYLLILTFRFYYGLRNVTPFVIGAAQIPRLRFFILNLIGAVVWAFTFAYGGYYLGEKFIEKGYALYVIGGILLLAFMFWLVNRIRLGFKAKELQKDDSPPVE